jgi:hypothetical protein
MRARDAEKRSAQFAKTSPSPAQTRRSCCVLQRTGPKKFTEPVALLSTSPGNLRLAPTALRSRFDLLALRARCKSNLTRRPRPGKTSPARKARILRTGNCPHFHGLWGRLGRTLWIFRAANPGDGSSSRMRGPGRPRARAASVPAFHNVERRSARARERRVRGPRKAL